MENRSVLVFCLLLLIGAVTGQSAPPRSSEPLLPQWLTGIIAVSSFLLLVFIGFVVKKMWCEKSSGTKQDEESMRSNNREEGNPYNTNMNSLRRTKSNESNNYETPGNDYETSTDVIRTRSSESNGYETPGNDYETSTNVLRPNSRKPRKEHIYETSLDVLRNQSRKNTYDNKAMDHIENKSTSM